MKLLRIYALLLCLSLGPALSAQVLQGDSLKASYIVNFIQFVEWEARDSEQDPVITIGVLGETSVAERLQSTASRQSDARNERPFTVRLVNSESDLSDLDLLYVKKGYRGIWPLLMHQAAQHQILLLGEEEGFIQHAGVIQFVTVKNHLRFSVNHTRAKELGIGLSSKLLKLATEVR